MAQGKSETDDLVVCHLDEGSDTLIMTCHTHVHSVVWFYMLYLRIVFFRRAFDCQAAPSLRL